MKILDIHMRMAGISRKKLGELAGISSDTLQGWWSGRLDIKLSMLEAALEVVELRLKITGKEIKS